MPAKEIRENLITQVAKNVELPSTEMGKIAGKRHMVKMNNLELDLLRVRCILNIQVGMSSMQSEEYWSG